MFAAEKAKSDIFEIINKMFNQEIEERIKMKEKNEDYPF